MYEEIVTIRKKKKSPKKSKKSLQHNSDSESDSKKDDLRLRLDARRKKRKQSLAKVAPKGNTISKAVYIYAETTLCPIMKCAKKNCSQT